MKRSKKREKKKRRRDGVKRPFNHSRFRRRHIALRVCYIGINYHGFALQDETLPTVELHLLQALEKTCLIQDRVSCQYSRCGRTDTGVSALGQVISVVVRSKQQNVAVTTIDTNTTITTTRNKVTNDTIALAKTKFKSSDVPYLPHEEELDYAMLLNRVLPKDIRIIAWCPVPDHFNARFSCSYRLYRYYFTKRQLDLEAMRVGGKYLLGQHDFRNFCKMDVVNVRNYNRELLSFNISPATTPTNTSEDLYYMEFKGIINYKSFWVVFFNIFFSF